MKTALMVAEKPSLAASLANILSNGRCVTRKGMLTKLSNFFPYIYTFFYILYYISYYISGLNGTCPVHEWVDQFRYETVNFKMTSVCGHVMTLDFIGKYNNWDKVDPVRLNKYMIFSFLLFIYLRVN